jgi:hypothetical protein
MPLMTLSPARSIVGSAQHVVTKRPSRQGHSLDDRRADAATKMAKERSELAVVAALAPVCVDKFRALPEADAKQATLSKVESWKRRDES